MAIIVLIPKEGKDKKVPSGYRPISLLAVLAKLFEKIMCRRLRKYAEAATKIDGTPMLPAEQSGFRNLRQTTDNLFRFMQMATGCLIRRQETVIVSLDGRKAFDTAAHKAILSPLVDLVQRKQLPFYLVSFYKQFLAGRTFKVRQGSEITEETGVIQAGVPQGSCSAPLLYIIFTADIPMPTNDPNKQSVAAKDIDPPVNGYLKCQIWSDRNPMEVGMFADDIAAWARWPTSGPDSQEAVKIRFQTFLDDIDKWANERKIVFNNEKTQLMKVVGRKQNAYPTMLFGGSILKYHDTLKYLGITFDNKLHLTKYMDSIVRKCNNRIKRLGFLTKIGGINQFTSMSWMQTLAFPLLQYGSMMWLPNIAHHNCVRKICSSARRRACVAPHGTLNSFLDIRMPQISLIQKCIQINRKWLEKTVGPHGYRNKSVIKSILTSNFCEGKRKILINKKTSHCVTPLELLQKDYY